jgi:hypothetical protein
MGNFELQNASHTNKSKAFPEAAAAPTKTAKYMHLQFCKHA